MISWPCWRICQKISSKKIIDLNTQYFSLKLCLLGLWTPGGEGLKWRETTLHTNDPSGGESGFSYLKKCNISKLCFPTLESHIHSSALNLKLFFQFEKRNTKTCASKRFFRGTVQRKWGLLFAFRSLTALHQDSIVALPRWSYYQKDSAKFDIFDLLLRFWITGETLFWVFNTLLKNSWAKMPFGLKTI